MPRGLTARRAERYNLSQPRRVNPSPSILVGCSQKVVCIRVQGKGSFQNSAGIKKFAQAMIHRGHRDFVVDLADCPVMDSTFMGTLTGVALRLHELGQGTVHIINANARNKDLLEGLGLDQILSMDGQGSLDEDYEGAGVCVPDADDALPFEPATQRSTAETMIAAHQALVDADPENFGKFKDVIDYLKQDLHQSDSASAD